MGVRERFPETSWTLLKRARECTGEGARAREEFAKRYYRPVHDFLYVLVQNEDQAQELTQEFFTKLSETAGLWEHARPKEGTFFRDYLLQALKNLVTDNYRHNRKAALQVYPDQNSTGGWDLIESRKYLEAEATFHDDWVRVTLAEARSRVRNLCLNRKQDVHLCLFEARYLSEGDIAPSWDELGARYSMDQKTARDRAGTVAGHFRRVLRRMLRNQLSFPGGRAPATDAEIDQEIKGLLSRIKD
jgi:DNA-directed RNA polymerase specialized sigma24 family protein